MTCAAILTFGLALTTFAAAQTCSGANSHFCGSSGGNADQPAIPQCDDCCCNFGFQVVTGTCDCEKVDGSANAATCGAFSYQCGAGDERLNADCSGCCCNYGYESAGDCNCQQSSKSPAPSPAANSGNTCGAYTYQCGTGDERELSGCGGCCCLFGYEEDTGCACAAASKSPAPSPVADDNTCGAFTYQCGSGDDREHSGCLGCCCNFGYEESADCTCAAASKSPAPSPDSADSNTCGAFTYQCGSGDDREHSGCLGCCCNFGFEESADCTCAAASKSPAPSPGTEANTCAAGAYQCGSGDDREHSECGGCCCNYGFEEVSGTCGCVAASSSPAPSVGTTSATCDDNAYQCGADDLRAHPDCSGCCCNYAYNPISNTCSCEAASKSPEPSPNSASNNECGAFSYECGNGDMRENTDCLGCCCNYGTVPDPNTCDCVAVSKSPAPSPGATSETCGVNSYQCNSNDLRAHPDCGGCCCNYNHDPTSNTCDCTAPTTSGTSNTCGTNSFDCGGAAGASQPSLTGAGCDQCCCNWNMVQNAGTCTCSAV